MLALGVGARVHEVRARAVAARHRELQVEHLREHRAEDVEVARHQREAIAERRRELGLEHRALGDVDVDEVRVAVVEDDVGRERHDEEDPDEHLEHLGVEVEVDRARHLPVGARPVDVDRVARSRHMVILSLIGPVPRPSSSAKSSKLEALARRAGSVRISSITADARPVEDRVAGLEVGVLAVALAQLDDARRARRGAGGDGLDVGLDLLGRARVVAEEPQRLLVELALVVELDAAASARPRGRCSVR